jgi:hypothetical protein
MASMPAQSATELTAMRQYGGNSKGVFPNRASAAHSASCLTPVAESVAENKVHGLFTDEIGSPEPYRYGGSSLVGEILVPIEAALDLAPEKGTRRGR